MKPEMKKRDGIAFGNGMPSKRGSLLIFVMWVLCLLSIFTFAVGRAVQQRLRAVETFSDRAYLRDIAEAGVKKALEVVNREKPDQAKYEGVNDAWSQSTVDFKEIQVGRGVFSVFYVDSENPKEVHFGVVDEESKLNLNTVKSMVVMNRLFESAAGLPKEMAQIISASLIDWIDEDDVLSEHGAETEYYQTKIPPYESKNAPIGSMEELLFIRGITPKIYAKILPFVTIYGDGKVNLNTARKPVLKAIGFSDQLIDKILGYRAGRDKIRGTEDDQVFRSLETVTADLNQFIELDDKEKSSLESFVR